MRVCEMLVTVWRPFSRHCTDVITFIGIFVNTVDIARCITRLSIVDRWSVWETGKRKKRKRHTRLSFYAHTRNYSCIKECMTARMLKHAPLYFPHCQCILYAFAQWYLWTKDTFVFHKKEPRRATCFCFSLLSFTYSENFKFFHLSIFVFLKIKSFKVTYKISEIFKLYINLFAQK